ncbi:HNH endonuclease [Dickeya phage Sucellus]|nr:HNH endonuclease [Dickeya phage Sucellus]
MPSLPPKQCRVTGCSGLAYAGNKGYCEQHKHKDWEDYQRDGSGFYQSNTWRKIKIKVIRRDCGLCQQCLRNGLYVPGVDVDHITPKSKSGSDELDNLELLCKKCHAHKTATE